MSSDFNAYEDFDCEGEEDFIYPHREKKTASNPASSSGLVAIRGNTYPVKDALKRLGGRWDGDAKVWRVPEAKAEEAHALVAGVKGAATPAAPGPAPLPEGSIQVSIGEGYGGRSYETGEVVLARTGFGYDLAFRLPETCAPGSCWTVTGCRRQYIREDGMSFGVGDDSGYLYTIRLRPSTEAEAAPVLAAEAVSRKRSEARAALDELFRVVEKSGEYEAGSHTLEGEEVAIPASGRRIYGGGQWFVIEETSGRIWTVTNNGMDGDDWSRNNVRTQGAGAIGRWVPFDFDLAARIRAMSVEAGAQEGDVE